MQDNYLESQYEPYNRVYCHESGHKLFLGDVTAAGDKGMIRKQKIGCVITAAIDMDHISFEQSIKHIRYNVFDSKAQNLFQLFQSFFELTESQLRRTNMLVHCFAGISRSATLIISYLMRKNKWSFKDTISEVRRHRPKVLPNLGFERQLKLYERRILSEVDRGRISRTNESKKGSLQKQTNRGLPQIFGFKQSRALPPPEEPASQPVEKKTFSNVFNHFRDSSYQLMRGLQRSERLPLSQTEILEPKVLPLKSFRKKSISTKLQKRSNKQEYELYSSQGSRQNLNIVFGQKANVSGKRMVPKRNRHENILQQYNAN